jgi:adenylate cyclase
MYGASFLVSGDTRARIADPTRFLFREVDIVTAKGKAQPVTIYEVLDADEDPVRDRKVASLTRYDEALRSYRAREFVNAEKLFRELSAASPDDAVFALYEERARAYREAPPAADWDAVERLDRK